MADEILITINEIQQIRLREKLPSRSLILEEDSQKVSAIRNSNFQIYFIQDLFNEIWEHAQDNLENVSAGLLVGLPFENFDDPESCFVFVGGTLNNVFANENSISGQFSKVRIQAAMETIFSIYQGFYTVGWYFSQPNCGVTLSGQNLSLANSFFAGFGNITLIIDPVQKEYGFFDHQEYKKISGFQNVSQVPPGVNLGREYNYHKYYGDQNISKKLFDLVSTSKHLHHWKEVGKYQDIEFNSDNVFISYSRQDSFSVEEVYQHIRELGYEPWMDIHDIKGGENWLRAIYKAIEESDIFLAVLSNNSVTRRGVIQKELKKALDKWEGMLPDDIYIVPLRIDDCPIPELLEDLHVIDWDDGKGKDKLLEAIQVGLERRRE
jgi:hypothetical protein